MERREAGERECSGSLREFAISKIQSTGCLIVGEAEERQRDMISKHRVYFVEAPMTGEKWKEVEASGLPYWAYNGPGEWIYRVDDGLHVCMVDEIGINPEP